jgi:hypothetical protein
MAEQKPYLPLSPDLTPDAEDNQQVVIAAGGNGGFGNSGGGGGYWGGGKRSLFLSLFMYADCTSHLLSR